MCFSFCIFAQQILFGFKIRGLELADCDFGSSLAVFNFFALHFNYSSLRGIKVSCAVLRNCVYVAA